MEERYRELKQIIEQRYRELNQAIVRIEIEHGEKLDALFDAFKINNENIKKQNERIHRCEIKILNMIVMLQAFIWQK